MTAASLAALTAIYFVTAVITVVTGSTTLITVPVMLQFGMEPRTAVATNMLALMVLSFGGVLPFRGTDAIDRRRLPLLLALTVIGSVAGALLLFSVPAKWMTLIIPVAMIVVLVFLLLQPRADAPARAGLGYSAMTLLSVYGGFLSGGYATLVTAAGLLLFRYPFLRAMAMARVLNTASSLVAAGVFAWYRIIDWRMGALLSIAGLAGGWIGAHWAQKMPALLLKRLFIATVAVLSVKSLIFDVPWRELI